MKRVPIKNKILVRQDFGFSIMEIMVVAGLLGVVAMFGTQMVSAQTKDQKRLVQKAETIDLKNNLSLVLGNQSTCACQFSGLTFDANAAAAPSTTSVNLTNGISYTCNAPNNPVVLPNALVPGTQTKLKIAQVSLQQIKAMPDPNQFLGTLQVTFDQSSTVGALAPLSTQVILYSNAASNVKTIDSCGGTTVTRDSVCDEVGGTYDQATQKCTMPTPPPPPNPATSCNNASVPPNDSGVVDGTCGQNNAYNYNGGALACAGMYSNGTPGYYTCTAAGWKCMGATYGNCTVYNNPSNSDDGGDDGGN